jgi:uncharacterized protein
MSATPREVLQRLIDGVTSQNLDDLHELYAEDTVVDHPLAIPAPSRMRGRDRLRRHFIAALDASRVMRAENLVVHETADPEVIVAEFDYVGHFTTTGRSFTVQNIFVLRVRDGQVVESRDYTNHFAFAQASGDRVALPG